MNKEQLLTSLHNTGLSEKGALVYLALLELGGAFPSQIARHISIKRSTVYEVLNDLGIKGLVSELKKRNKYFYSIENPKRLVNYGERTIAKAIDQNEKLKEFLPDLEGLYASTTNKPKVSYFKGVNGVMEIYEDHINTKVKYEMVGFVNVAELMRFLPQKQYINYVKNKGKIGITTRGIIPDTPEDRSYEKTIYISAQKKIMPQVRYIPKNEFPWKGDITVYGQNKISIVNFDEQQISGIIIENETINKIMRMIFELAWKSAGKNYTEQTPYHRLTNL